MAAFAAQHWGQSTFRLAAAGVVIYTDPYLSDSVERLEGPSARRLRPAPRAPHEIDDADWVVVSHDHLDHCDPDTLVPLLAASPRARVLAPEPARRVLMSAGVDPSRLVSASESWHALGDAVRVHPIIAAHPRPARDASGAPTHVGFVFDHAGHRVYFAGDTKPDEAVLRALDQLRPIATAILPINEKNFFRDAAGIVGNMSVREAFGMTHRIGAQTLVPMHYDMFAPNSVLPDEVRVLHDHAKPPFTLAFDPTSV